MWEHWSPFGELEEAVPKFVHIFLHQPRVQIARTKITEMLWNIINILACNPLPC